MKTNHQIKKRQIGAIAIAMITGTGLILGILLSLLCYQLGMYKDQSKKEILLRSCKTTLPQIMTEQMSIYTENTLQR